MLFRAISILALVALGAAHPQEEECGVICVDAINDCGVQYGGCYDPCTDPKPVAPPCPSSSSSGAPEDCPTICVDAINDCAQAHPAALPADDDSGDGDDPRCFLHVDRDRLRETPTPTAVLTWGGCRGACESPTFTEPDCPTYSYPLKCVNREFLR
ncbi:hypothetical protein F5X96DRAFT_666145 [Biscogniauxia mediterranea]|nr:hypothetical protein F5X96DRAFT_666145 [Biscogniauxia mediterranea]